MKWTEETARTAIADNNGIVGHQKLWISRPGIKLLGAIDFLTRKQTNQPFAKYYRHSEPFGGRVK